MRCASGLKHLLARSLQYAYGRVLYPMQKKQLRGTNIPIATVVNFPGGNQDVDITRAETRAAIEDGAGEIDLVMPYQAFRAGDLPRAQTMVRSIAETAKDRALLKVILETGELQDPETDPVRK